MRTILMLLPFFLLGCATASTPVATPQLPAATYHTQAAELVVTVAQIQALEVPATARHGEPVIFAVQVARSTPCMTVRPLQVVVDDAARLVRVTALGETRSDRLCAQMMMEPQRVTADFVPAGVGIYRVEAARGVEVPVREVGVR